MKTITINNLSIQIDVNEGEDNVKAAHEAIMLINQSLQREPHGLGAQILSSGLDGSDIQESKNEEEEI